MDEESVQNRQGQLYLLGARGYSGEIYTSSTLPSSVRDGATCWCNDIHMNLTYYNNHWYKPDGTQFS